MYALSPLRKRRKRMQVKTVAITAAAMLTGAFIQHQYIAANTPVYIQPAQPYRETVSIAYESGMSAPEEDRLPMDSHTDMVESVPRDTLELMALVIEAEAANQGYYGKQLVADVILNRVDSNEFPDSIARVLLQPNAFSTIWDGAAFRAEPTQETYDAIAAELMHRCNTDILYFTSEGFSEYGRNWKKVGGHYFSTKKEADSVNK